MLLIDDTAVLTPPAPAGTFELPVAPRRTGRPAFATLAITALLFAFVPFLIDAVDAARHGRVFLGVAGWYPMDGLQYLAWVREAHHGLIRNLFGPAGGAVFVHPMWTLSGLLQGFSGASDAAVLAFWKTASVLVLAAGAMKAAQRVPERPRLLTAAVAVFGGLTPLVLGLYAIDGDAAGGDLARAAGDLVPALALWDYAPLAIAVGLMPFALDGADRLLSGERSGGLRVRVAALGLLVGWLHPWQAETLVLAYAGLAAWRALADPSRPAAAHAVQAARALLLPALAAGLPLLYYLALSRYDAGWGVSEHSSVDAALIPFPVLASAVLPLLALAVPGLRRARADIALRPAATWFVATVITVAVSRSGQYRAIDGLMVPVAVLGVAGLARVGGRVRALLALALLVPVPALLVAEVAHEREAHILRYTELERDDVRALRAAVALDGGRTVLTRDDLGTAEPALTDTATWLGHPIWTPERAVREQFVRQLLAGRLTARQAAAMLRESAVGAVVVPCGVHAAISVGGVRSRSIGCARILVVAPAGTSGQSFPATAQQMSVSGRSQG